MSCTEKQDTEADTSLFCSLMEAWRPDPPDSPDSTVSMSDNSSMQHPDTDFRDISTDPSLILAETSGSAGPSCTSVKSSRTMEEPFNFREGVCSGEISLCCSLMEAWRPDPPDSSVSMRSNSSMQHPDIDFRDKDISTDPRSENKTNKKQLNHIYEKLEHVMNTSLINELKRQKNLLSPDDPAFSEREVENDPVVTEAFLKITIHFLKKMNETDLANTLQMDLVSVYQEQHRSKMRDKYKRISETSQHGSSVLLNEIYTELYITEGWSGDVNNEHEVRQIEMPSKRATLKEKRIKCNDLFKDKSIRSVLTKGVAGIGKTVSVQKFILDWSEGKANQDLNFMFPLPFRELNLMKEKHLSLINLLHQFFPEIKELQSINFESYKVLLIFDGLDECRLPLNFQNNVRLCDVTESASVDVLLTNLIKENLLPSALLWITSRPGAANQIPPEYINQVTDVQGFSDPQKEEYFRKKISDQSLANKIITHMKSSRSLYIMCHIPVFCWISVTVLKRMLGKSKRGEIPKTLTQMFTHFLIFQIKHKDQKYHQRCDSDPQQTRDSILALGKLAFQQLGNGNLIFYEEDLRECGIDVREVSVYSGLCTRIFREEFGLHLGKVFSFVHLSVQEFLAALYAFLNFINKDLSEQQTTDLSDLFTKSNMSDFLKTAVDKALQSENGHLDLFLRFLLGLSLESNQSLQSLLPNTGNSSQSKEETVKFIKEKIRENPPTEKSINLFHCLNELNDNSLVQEVQNFLKPGGYNCLLGINLSSLQWSALVFVLLMSAQEHEEFDLRTYNRSEECFVRLLPVIKEYRKAVLCGCNLSEESCRALSSAISSDFCRLRELYLSDNNLRDTGVKLLSDGLGSSHCKLEKLWLMNCGITDEGCVALASALKSNSKSNLRDLNLNRNKPGDRGVRLLSDLKEDTNCKLKALSIVPDPYEKEKSFPSYLSNKSSNPDVDLAEFLMLQKRDANALY